MRCLSLLPFTLLFVAPVASAQTQTVAAPVSPMGAAAASPPAEPKRHQVSITFSPIHLFMPIVELTGELALDEKIGVAGIVGVGSIPLTTTTIGAGGTKEETEHLTAWEVGGHFNYYAIGTFDHGMQLGVEALYLKVASEGSTYRSAAAATGFAVGPYVGYKVISNVGFTFEGNLGFEYVAARAEATSGTSNAKAENKTIIPLLNLNVGWSF